MKAVGLVVEYNPFHNGHLYHLNQSKELAQADVTVACMSGNFLQRGEPALIDKYARTKMALKAGVDIVVELPVLWSSQHADIFAKNSVMLLNELGCDSLCFGSEQGDIDSFIQAYSLLKEHQPLFHNRVKEEMKKGHNYATATGLAMSSFSSNSSGLDLSLPNNTLGFHYVAEIMQQYPSMKPLTFGRLGSGYHDTSLHESGITSATSIRKAIFGKEEDMTYYMPDSTREELLIYSAETGIYHSWEQYWKLLQYKICSSSPEQLRRHYEVKEGIEYRLIEFAVSSTSFSEFVSKVKTKRYTWTRIQRICLYLLLNIESDFMEHHKQPSYIRILGFSKNGQAYLNKVKKDLSLPILNNKLYQNPAFQLNVRASQIYYNIVNIDIFEQKVHQEFERPILADLSQKNEK